MKQPEPVPLNLPPLTRPAPPPAGDKPTWTQDHCPNCAYPQADVDPEGILWCPACGYSKKGCYT